MLIQDIVRTASTHISEGAEAVAALVIVSGIVRGAWMYVSALFRSGVEVPATTIRLSVGTSRPRPRDFLLAADILATAVAPTWDEIGKLAAIAAIRTGLNYFLEGELRIEASQSRVGDVARK